MNECLRIRNNQKHYFMKLIITTLLWLSISFCQTTKQSSGALNPNIGMSAGTYANAGTDKLEVDG